MDYVATYDWLNKFYSFYALSIVNRCGLKVEACHSNQANNSKLALYNLLLSL